MELLYFNPYSLPAIVALGLKILLLGMTGVTPLRHSSESRVFLAFLFVLALHNVAEILGLNHPPPADADTMVNLRAGLLYFTMSIVAMAILLHLVLVRLKASTDWGPPIEDWRCWSLLYAPAAAVLTVLWMSDAMIKGFVAHGFSYTRVPGPLYHWFEWYAIIYLVAALGTLILSVLCSSNRRHQRKSLIMLAGIAPLILMPIVVILLQKLGFESFNLPLWFALALTFFLMVTAYAIHEHRLFNLFLRLPGTRMGRRHTAFHRRIKRFVAELDRLPDLNLEQALGKLAAALRCSVAIVESGRTPIRGQPLSSQARQLRLERLSEQTLGRFDQIVATRELKRDYPGTYATLRDANCAAVIPFRPFKDASAGWLLIGGGKTAPDEAPVDFVAIESLFDKLGDLFLETIVREREQLSNAKQELEKQVSVNRELQQALDGKQDTIDALYGRYAAEHGAAAGLFKLEELTAGLEKKMITETLARLQGNVSATAKSLGLTRQTLYAKMENYGIDSDRWRRRKAARRNNAGPRQAKSDRSGRGG